MNTIDIYYGQPIFKMADLTMLSIMETATPPHTFVTQVVVNDPDILDQIKDGCYLTFSDGIRKFLLPISAAHVIETEQGWIATIAVTLTGYIEDYAI